LILARRKGEEGEDWGAAPPVPRNKAGADFLPAARVKKMISEYVLIVWYVPTPNIIHIGQIKHY
jgi:hypothetical protein